MRGGAVALSQSNCDMRSRCFCRDTACRGSLVVAKSSFIDGWLGSRAPALAEVRIVRGWFLAEDVCEFDCACVGPLLDHAACCAGADRHLGPRTSAGRSIADDAHFRTRLLHRIRAAQRARHGQPDTGIFDFRRQSGAARPGPGGPECPRQRKAVFQQIGFGSGPASPYSRARCRADRTGGRQHARYSRPHGIGGECRLRPPRRICAVPVGSGFPPA